MAAHAEIRVGPSQATPRASNAPTAVLLPNLLPTLDGGRARLRNPSSRGETGRRERETSGKGCSRPIAPRAICGARFVRTRPRRAYGPLSRLSQVNKCRCAQKN
jgi:hypothetical protein